jgi:hypothetical protein
MAQSLFELSNATFGDTKHTYVKASLNGATRTREVTVFAAGIASSISRLGGSFGIAAANNINAGARIQAENISRDTTTGSFINVCDDFDWTISPHGGSDANAKKRLIPRGEIKEYRVEDTAVIGSIIFASEATTSAIGQVAGQITGIVKKTGFEKPAAAGEGDTNLIKSVVENAAKTGREYAGISNPDFPTSKWMLPYKDLYSLKPTGFKYLLPYLSDQALSELRNSWPDLTYPLSPNLANVQSTVTNTAKIAAPGQYIEKPKMFDPGSSSIPRVTFNFPLFNTQSYEQACANYQLLWLLIFQNTPQRVTKSLLEMPKMYSVNIPGVCYMQYSHVESLEIKFIGNRRHVDITMPGNSIGLGTSIPAIMPDAYDVSITFTSLNISNSNMLLEMWKQAIPQNIAL